MTIPEALGAALGYVIGSLVQGGLFALGGYFALQYIGVL